MALATITGNRSDIAGLPEKGDIRFKPTVPTQQALSPRWVKAATNIDGDFTIQLQPGTHAVTIFNKDVTFTVPDDGATHTLWSLIAAAIALPPATTQQKLNAAVAQIIDGGGTDILTKPVADTTYAPLGLVSDTIEYNPDGTVEYAIAGGIRTDYTWNLDGTCHTETSQGLVKTWTYDGSGNPISSTVTEA